MGCAGDDRRAVNGRDAPEDRSAALHDRPDAPELLAAVAEWLIAELLPAAPPDQRFHARVAAHVCAMVAREWEATAPDAAAAREAQGRLAGEIRSGAWDDRFQEAVEALRDAVRAKLAVARPGWDAVADDGR
jgi:Domain of unknown function (DUF6285)